MTNEDGYCGFVCGDIIERQQKIIDDIKDFSDYNKEFALVMFGKIIEMSYNAAQKLPRNTETIELPTETIPLTESEQQISNV